MLNSSEAPTQLTVIFLLLYLLVKRRLRELHKNFQLLFNIFKFLSSYSVAEEILLM